MDVVVSPDFANLHWNVWSPEGSRHHPHGQYGYGRAATSKCGRHNFCLKYVSKIQGGRLLEGLLPHRAMRG
jgi:hypothetical protein